MYVCTMFFFLSSLVFELSYLECMSLLLFLTGKLVKAEFIYCCVLNYLLNLAPDPKRDYTVFTTLKGKFQTFCVI